MRIELFEGLIIAGPLLLYQIWAFISPGLTGPPRRRSCLWVEWRLDSEALPADWSSSSAVR